MDKIAHDMQAPLSNVNVQDRDAQQNVNCGNMVDEEQGYGYSMSLQVFDPSVAVQSRQDVNEKL